MFNKHSMRVGFSFGTTSGIITTLGLIVGLNSGTHSQLVIIGGILTIAIADSFSDALGIHISEESEGKHSEREVWESTICTFLAKFIFALIFIVPILLLELSVAIIVSIILGLVLLSFLSFLIAKKQNTKTWKVVLEHLIIVSVVIFLADYMGNLISSIFN